MLSNRNEKHENDSKILRIEEIRLIYYSNMRVSSLMSLFFFFSFFAVEGGCIILVGVLK
jgi:hypothetical protein